MGASEGVLRVVLPQACELLDENRQPARKSRSRLPLNALCCRGDEEDMAAASSENGPGPRKPRTHVIYEGGAPSASSNRDGDLSPSSQAWTRRLFEGAVVALDGEPVHIRIDTELGCLEVREHETLCPLAELRICRELPQKPGDIAAAFELMASFGELDTLLFQFDEAEHRAGFRAALEGVAHDARQGSTFADVVDRSTQDTGASY
eukprot:CAMPEP_0170628690 /NCGR_PEP_ID=MMETSP0224-20130122/32849_1 /TAXON_ID=285029 /ORGANISM="Togula jolla, Strain CCCM 725" /LENGTH=205 /DNA_ID=CAMNT_0010956193 /DNA_START=90 /DNA_END=704 /DNA_ORIENTATION=+